MMNMKLEVLVIPVSDVDRAKAFYEKLGFRLDIDYVPDDKFRVLQFTPPRFGGVDHFRQGTYVEEAWLGGRPDASC